MQGHAASDSNIQRTQCEENCEPSQRSSGDGAASWAGSFEKLLDDPIALQTFAEFLKKEFSAENIYFWTACERYRRICKPSERSAEAQRIHRRHLCPGAPEPVNVDSAGRQFTGSQLQEADPRLFEQPQKQIFNLMKFDSYPRFLKSELYRQCVAGTADLPPLEPGLTISTAGNMHNKLKKSLSNAEDRRRKSLLPWHRKNRSKSKDRGETEYQQRQDGSGTTTPGNTSPVKSGTGQPVHSSQSSLTSLDLAMTATGTGQAPGNGSEDQQTSLPSKAALCRVILCDGATTVVQIRPTETVRQLANRLLDKRGLNYSAYEVFIADQTKPLDLNELSVRLASCEVTIEQRVVFKLDLPNRKVISVKSKSTKILVDVLRPILHKYGFGLDFVRVSLGPDEYVDVDLPVTTVDGCRLNIQKIDEANKSALLAAAQKPKPSLDEITNKVFEQLLHEKSETSNSQPLHVYDKSSVKSEDWGSEHSSGIFGRFLRRDSGLHERKKKLNALRNKQTACGNSVHSSVEDIAGDPAHATKKPLIAKWKAGVKLHTHAQPPTVQPQLPVNCSESDELYEGLKRAQRSRLEDQRGTEINFELPDFLKDKENQQTSSKFRKIQQNGSETRFYDGEMTILSKSEKSPPLATTRCLKPEVQAGEERKDDSMASCRGFSSLDNSMVDNTTLKEDDAPKSPSEPPPLPPKPKVLPIKPSNWGHNTPAASPMFKIPGPKPERSKHTLYLEQPTSSFV